MGVPLPSARSRRAKRVPAYYGDLNRSSDLLLKFLLLLAVIFAVYWLFKSFKRKAEGGAKPPAPAGAEDMVRCAMCGLHLPRSESLPAGTQFYCSADHRRQSEPSD
jgi:uncharacterized protein